MIIKCVQFTHCSSLFLPPPLFPLQKLDIRDNPDLTMPPKPVQQVKGSGAEWYNIDFDPEILKKGAVVSSAQVIKGQRKCYLLVFFHFCMIVFFLPGAYTRQKVRRSF